MTVFDEPRMKVVEPRTWHRAGRPSWDCVVCHQPWPCTPAKVELAEEFVNDRVSGTIYLAMNMHDAINDSFHRAGPEPAELWNRFLGWFVALRPKHTAERPTDGCAASGSEKQQDAQPLRTRGLAVTDAANADTPPTQSAPIPLVGIPEISDLLVQITRQCVLELTLRSDFPEPAAELAAGEVWCREDVDAWIDEHREAVADMFKQGR